MIRLSLPFLSITFALALVAASHAPVGRCDSAGQPALGIFEVTAGKADATFYVDDRNYVLGNGVWMYQESNGVWTSQGPGVHAGDLTEHNLQRGGPCGGASGPTSECTIPDDNEICSDRSDAGPDLLIF